MAVVALHVGALAKPFFADDYFFLEQVRDRRLAEALGSPDPIGNFLRPVSRQAWFWTLSAAGGQAPALFRGANLLVFAASLMLLHRLVRRFGGRTAALVAMALAAFHYAADVPLRWASGSQDLLAVFFGLLAVSFQCARRPALAALALALGLLSKEAIAGAALVAIVASHAPGERVWATVRRGAGLLAVTVAWAGWWIATLPQRAAAGHAVALDPWGALAALAHLVQVAMGFEVRLGGVAFGHWGLPPLALATFVGALVWLGTRSTARDVPGGAPHRGRMLRLGITWTATGLLPLAVVMPIWSAYFYLWTLFGLALLAAAAIGRLPPAPRAAAVALAVLLSGQARRLDEFAVAGGAWSWQSHVNRHYVDRSLATVERFLAAMKAARPTLPRRATVFFANVPVSSGWQAGDGPLLRWAYRDTSLRSYFMTQFTRERARRGPLFFFAVEGGGLRDRTADPLLLPSFAYSMLLAERPAAAIEALDLAIEGVDAGARATPPADATGYRYWRAWARWAEGDTLGAREDLEALGLTARRDPHALEEEGPADTATRIERLGRRIAGAALEPRLHARLAALSLASGGPLQRGVVEAFAWRTLAPDDPRAWRLWAAAQLVEEQPAAALQSLERYAALESATPDPDAERVMRSLRRRVRGDVAHQATRAGR